MPAPRNRQTTLRAQLDALDTALHDAETYLKLADTLDGFLTRLADGPDQVRSPSPTILRRSSRWTSSNP